MRLKPATLIGVGVIVAACFICAKAAFAQEESAEESSAPKASAGTGANTTAKAKPAGTGVKGDKKQTKIDFEDELVEGELKKPELFYLLQKKQFNFKRLIKLREDFLPEMRRDGDEVRKGRGR